METERQRGKRIVVFEVEIDEEAELPFNDGDVLSDQELADHFLNLIDHISKARVKFESVREQENLERNNSEQWVGHRSWTVEIRKIANDVFGFSSFRNKQEEILNAILSGIDVFACLPTGSGKSLLYQLPPLILSRSKGVSIIIVPIIALSSDQKRLFDIYNIPCKILCSSKPFLDRLLREILKANQDGKVKPVLFSSPEIINNSLVFEFLQRLSDEGLLDRVYFDEAHCILEWGGTFRQSYLSLKKLRSAALQVPQIVMLTGSAPPMLRKSLISTMKMNDPAVFVQSHNRTNLFIEVTSKKGLDKDIVQILKVAEDWFRGRSGIIYCRTKKSCEEVKDKLKSKGFVKCAVFTGDMSVKEKERVLFGWMREDIYVVVATLAFGMGINKPDCRYVIHYDLPSSMEAYYQGIGRAGRDGYDSLCLLFFDYKDIRKQDLLLQNDSKSYSKYMNFYIYCLETYRCRRLIILGYFENYTHTECNYCDNCILRKQPKIVSSVSAPLAAESEKPGPKKNTKAPAKEKIKEEAPKKGKGKSKTNTEVFSGTGVVIGSNTEQPRQSVSMTNFFGINPSIPTEEKAGGSILPSESFDLTDCAYRLHEELIILGYSDSPDQGGGGGKKRKKGKKAPGADGTKLPTLTTIKLSDALVTGKEKGLESLKEVLPGTDSSKRETMAYFVLASMIRDGMLFGKWVSLKKVFGFMSIVPNSDIGEKDTASEKYILECGTPYKLRNIEVVEYLRHKTKSESEVLFDSLVGVRSTLFHRAKGNSMIEDDGDSVNTNKAVYGNNTEDSLMHSTSVSMDNFNYKSVEHFLPTAVAELLNLDHESAL